MKDSKQYFIRFWILLSMFLMLSSSMHYAPPLYYTIAVPQANIMAKSAVKKKIRQLLSKKKPTRKAKKYRLAGFFQSLGTFLAIMGLLILVLSPLLIYLFFPHIVNWVLFLAGMVSAALLAIFFFLLIYGNQKEFWLWFSGVFALIFLACFVGLLLSIPIFVSLSILGTLLLILLAAIAS